MDTIDSAKCLTRLYVATVWDDNRKSYLVSETVGVLLTGSIGNHVSVRFDVDL